MSVNLSYVLITPYSISKSRTGGVIARLLSRTDLELVGAQIFTPDETFVKKYADMLRPRAPQDELKLIADYVEKNLGPSVFGKRHRSLLLLFKGENPCEKLLNTCGCIYTKSFEVETKSAETIRETYSDLVYSNEKRGEIIFFEPAVLTARLQEDADADLGLFADFLETQNNIVSNVTYPDPSKIERTLVIIKPDNWTYHSSKPGAIVEMFSRTGLRIVGTKIHSFSMEQAMQFYSPVKSVFNERLAPVFGQQALELLEKNYDFKFSEESAKQIAYCIGIERAKNEFNKLVYFMSGKHPGDCLKEDADKSGNAKCMILIYEGENAIKKIRDVLGPTDPQKAPEGTVRREFGSNIMVNTAHASDSKESYEWEKSVVHPEINAMTSIIREYLKQG